MEETLEGVEQMRKHIQRLYAMIDQLTRQLRQMEAKLYQSCRHVWVIDRTVVSEHTERICTQCGLKYNEYPLKTT